MRAVGATHRLATEVLEHQLAHGWRHRPLHLDADGGVVGSPLGRVGHGAEQIVRAALVEVQVSGARDAKEMGSVDARIRVEEIHVGAEHLLDRDHRERTAGHGQQTLGVARQLELGQVRLAPRAAAEHDGERQPEVGQVGQRMPGLSVIASGVSSG